jgi:hypothetical protein
MSALALDLRSIARALGGEVTGGSVLAPGPGHSPKDRSLSVKLSATAPEGFLAFSHANDDFATCRDYVKAKLGMPGMPISRQPTEGRRLAPDPRQANDERADKIADALAFWRAAIDPHETPVERYLRSRDLDLGDDIAGSVLRWHPGTGAMVVLFRNVDTDKPQAISRTFLDREARKLGRKFLGPVGGAAVKLDPDENVLGGLHIGEGVETCLAARSLGLRPTWALGSAGAIAAFPPLSGIECLTLLREHDEANARAADAVTTSWQAAGRDVFDVWPNVGKDVNDAIRGGNA